MFLTHVAQAEDNVIDLGASLNPIEKTSKEIDKIKLKFLNPMEDIDQNMESFKKLIILFEEFKKFDLDFTQNLLNKIQNQDTLSGTELFFLRRTITIYYKINKKILDFAKVYDVGRIRMSKTFASDIRNIPMIKAHLIWLTGHLLVLDHLENMHHILYEKDGNFRRIVKNALLEKISNPEGIDKTLNDLIKICEYSVDIGESLKFSQQINLVRSIKDELKSSLEFDPKSVILIDAIYTNPTSKLIAQGRTHFSMNHFYFLDSVITTVNKIAGWFSQIFGNIAGSVHWRKGHLFKNAYATDRVKKQLRPMDILIEKSPFVLTDKFIPGHFGHVAVYLGTKEELISIGMWNHPDIIAYHEQIEAGKVVLEAVRSGVTLNRLEDFLNVDEMSIIRKIDEFDNQNLVIDQVARGMDQIGKEYDFNFDISTLDKIVCSELVYIVYGNTHWPTQYRFGRPTITPDDIAEILFQKETRYKVIDFMVSKDDDKIETAGLDFIAEELDYELRTSNGDPIVTQADATNSYWKKETKCYNVSSNGASLSSENSSDNSNTRYCKTSYKEYIYEERDSI